ncbi:sigma-54-dependent transcriptional regulator [Usitatibacter palustris]|uniref:Regulatory protein AtoC n=1 Tax=Usitatibacter palustris TaxID=2732487 RepID=A0A6M4HAR7_9PROT|nr:sigma-54 dependent transcriptional regulator [Usitatibacter palustris]QJR15137.1 Regulatory protein AtoC [Usitatibacter palustris]
MAHVLIVEDDPTSRHALTELVKLNGFTAASAGSIREARIQVGRQQPDVALIDLKLPDGSGMELLEEFEDLASTQVVLITGYASVETAVAAMRQGAADYLIKPVDMQRLEAILERVSKTGSPRVEIGRLKEELQAHGRFGRLVGRSPAMLRAYEQIARVAPTEATVFITGESGTGKEVVAHTVHDLSLRRTQPFLAINCGAISPNLIESEMFGHERGSFTGAERLHRGYFEQAHGGTLFLDEISEMPLELQVRLLRVLETRTLMRIGTAVPIEVDVRIIAATNRDPRIAVEAGRLRPDLYHRLNVFPLVIPPLRQREGDVALLARSFVAELNTDRGGHSELSSESLATLESHNWPGNVRELRNYIHRLAILGRLDAKDPEPFEPMPASEGQPGSPAIVLPVGTSLAAADRQLIMTTLDHCGGDKRRAADMLGICVKTLYNRLKEYGGGPSRRSQEVSQ